ncbi:Serine/threonine phosphatase stp [Slackia heliotrinireducens]|uniref:Serine/threonine protein phosphatase n=1 Tax=Slackia heliotrinireducens (strain ATCC 29202 / DSM 20476 / NCTC 11029 / RHS 1) TaxID=471855 RepID=C7N289_SLAHD|nr:PP2C family serine/threonine-protein phosphatase [Slackia heliotrinireducens]ACV21395.1 serine/threonine protein phosphatase [Slackia heliotrinireducens DSM 20476]VEG98828.1 Serine/threonine phosphatase stp [Slackia heliotrinireducens]
MDSEKRLKLTYAVATERGRRQENEDCATVGISPTSGRTEMLAVSDGIGGGLAGAELSRHALAGAKRAFESGLAIEDVVAAAEESVATCRASLDDWSVMAGPCDPFNLARIDGAGATLVAMVLSDSGASLAWLGDSVAYILRDGRVSLLTPPHRAAGTERLTRALGFGQHPELASIEVRAGDTLLLCTDGVWSSLSCEETAMVLANNPLQAAATELVVRGAESSGDNATVILAKVAEIGRLD